MVAYSFQPRFAEPILAGTKAQTIRGQRKRHARPGETMQLYVGMRTKSCRLITARTCVEVTPIRLIIHREEKPDAYQVRLAVYLDGEEIDHCEIERLARADGFGGDGCAVADMAAFWFRHHKTGSNAIDFDGVMLRWAMPS